MLIISHNICVSVCASTKRSTTNRTIVRLFARIVNAYILAYIVGTAAACGAVLERGTTSRLASGADLSKLISVDYLVRGDMR